MELEYLDYDIAYEYNGGYLVNIGGSFIEFAIN